MNEYYNLGLTKAMKYVGALPMPFTSFEKIFRLSTMTFISINLFVLFLIHFGLSILSCPLSIFHLYSLTNYKA